jgi:oxygen-dependent protoporphyrinogen oxidase
VERLEQELNASGVQILKGCGVQEIVQLSKGDDYRITLEDGQTLAADGAILALPAYESYKLLGGVPEAEGLKKTPYVTVANVVFGFRKEALDADLSGSGFVVPRSEGRFITASTWVSSKWPHTAPQDKVLLRGYIGRLGAEAPVEWSDSQLAEGFRQELNSIMGIDAEPEFALATRWKKAMPQYTVGHLERVHRLRTALEKQYPRLLVCGSGYDGVGLPDCIGQGEETARRMMASFDQ